MSNIDLSYLKSVTDGDTELMKELVDIFKTQVPEYVQEFKEALAENNFDALSKIAHKSKSSIAIMGLSDLASTLGQFEIEAKDGTASDKYESYIADFEKECYEALEQIETMI